MIFLAVYLALLVKLLVCSGYFATPFSRPLVALCHQVVLGMRVTHTLNYYGRSLSSCNCRCLFLEVYTAALMPHTVRHMRGGLGMICGFVVILIITLIITVMTMARGTHKMIQNFARKYALLAMNITCFFLDF